LILWADSPDVRVVNVGIGPLVCLSVIGAAKSLPGAGQGAGLGAADQTSLPFVARWLAM
jgi:hypothetical protein